MTPSLQEWVTFFQRSDPLVGVPLVIGGLAIMAFGWRVWKVLVVASFALVGLLIPLLLVTDRGDAIWYGVGAGMLLGMVSHYLVRLSVPVLGGLVGAAILGPVLEGIGLRGPALWAGMGLAFCATAGLAAINQRYVIVLVTAFEGAVLLIAGVTALMTTSPQTLNSFKGMATGNALIMGFMVLVPTVVSFFYQISEVNRLGHEV